MLDGWIIPLVVGVDLHPVGRDLCLDVPVTQKHGGRLLALGAKGQSVSVSEH